MVDVAVPAAVGGLRGRIALPALLPAVLAAVLVQGCGGSGGDGTDASPAAGPLAVTRLPARAMTLAEDGHHAGSLTFDGADPDAVYRVATAPAHGALVLAADGAFAYTPAPDFHGRDAFGYQVEHADGARFTGTVDLDVVAVNDPPALAAIAAEANGVAAPDVVVPLGVTDIDGDTLRIAARSDDTRIAEVQVDQAGRLLRIRGRDYGTTVIAVTVSDGTAVATREFSFTVADRERRVTVPVVQPASSAIVLANGSGERVEVELTHNGKRAFTSLDQIVAAVRAQPDEMTGEPFERKLWRYLRDNTLRYPPVGGAGWLDGTWPTLNSFGWGFCSNVTSAFIQIAAAAGYEARAWTLAGHVLPEILIDGAWQAWDPDVAVVYRRRDGAIASVADLALDPTLITSPQDPLFAAGSAGYQSAYDPVLAQIYGSTGDNVLATWYPAPEPYHGARISLPAGARLIYPGLWTADPTGYDGATPYPVEFARQARLEIPAGIVGRITVPWVLWDVQGAGTVEVGNATYAAGSPGLAATLAATEAAVTEVEILANPGGVALVMMINPAWYEVLATNEIILTGKDTWAIVPTVVTLAADKRVNPVPARVRRPAG